MPHYQLLMPTSTASITPKDDDLRVTNDTNADDQIREGYPIDVAARLQEVLGLSDETMAEILGRSRRTYRRYQSADKRLGLSESERLFRYLRLLSRAEEVFGSQEKAAWWMNEPNAALDGREPVEVALTTPGAVVVEDLLGGLEHGFPL
ncbi:type II RES/Xre toxin-antitoxin system antitoxin [Salinibacter ruber]|jgi:putative toxin-antitoxin system antitoxin component (TIGR02293 family)|uniref:type II RES/Xre toxin-antitoxin system antitoxin n=1 Tax=Salinibacter ruber TaxID=146919 RepID=UPI002169074F|nr:antitoxin Xre/MbcA/ParS toxin-binding domain-containing protein [Salinibacter ruber]